MDVKASGNAVYMGRVDHVGSLVTAIDNVTPEIYDRTGSHCRMPLTLWLDAGAGGRVSGRPIPLPPPHASGPEDVFSM